MFPKSIVAASAAFSLIVSTSALYDASSPANLAVYWGAVGGQQELGFYCNQSTIDIINVAFIEPFPQQNGGLLGEGFGNQCWGTPTYAGSNGNLPENCPLLQDDLPYCQKVMNKKIILSVGGGTATYQLTGKQAGIDFATMLWQMYGPYNATYVAGGGIRPLDRSSSNTNTSPFYQIDVDGFDFDIEVASTDGAVGYIAMIQTLRALFATNPCKKYVITGAPQCNVPDAIMDLMIQNAEFDALYVQFYNAPDCSARTWVKGNSALNTTNGESSTAGFTYDSWVSRTSSGASKNAKIYIGLLGAPGGSTTAPGDFLWPEEATNLIDTYVTDTRFGGVMLWDATWANGQQVSFGKYSGNYYGFIKSVLANFAPKTTAPVVPLCQSTTSSSSSASTTSTTTTSTTSSSSTSTTTSSSSSSSSSITSSSSSSSIPSTSSTSTTSATSAPTNPSSCEFLACWTEGANGVRALPGNHTIDHTLMSEEICYDFCVTQNGYSYFGLEYAGECWCGDALDPTSTQVDASFCSIPCDGTPDEFCGGNNVLDVYFCGGGAQTSSVSSSSQSTTASTSATSTSSSSSSVSSTSASTTTTTSSSTTTTSTSASTTTTTSSSTATTSQSSSSSTSTSSSSSSASTSSSTSSSSSSATSTSSSSSSASTSSTGSSSSSATSATSSSTSASSTSESTTSSTSSSTSQSSSSATSTSSSSSSASTSSSASSSSSSATSTTSSSSSASSTSESTTSSTSSSTSQSSSSVTPTTSSSSSTSSTSISGTSTSSASVVTTSASSSTSSTSPTSIHSSSSSSSSQSSTYSSTGITSSSSSVTTTSTKSLSGSSSSSGVVSTSPSSNPPGVSTTSSSSSTAKGSGVSQSSSSSVQSTTSTVRETKTYTITSCAATVTDCPARIGKVTTVTIDLYTTVCPVTETEGGGGKAKATSTPMTTSTVYTTKVYTITSCAPTVTNCPARIGSVTTEIISLYTTVCPVAEATATPGVVHEQSSAGASESTTTIMSTVTTYRTVKVINATATVVPQPVAPYPTGSASSGGVAGTGPGLPSVSMVFVSPTPTEATSAAGGATTSPRPSPLKGAATKMGAGSLVVVVLTAIVAFII